MTRAESARFRRMTLDELTIDDERAFRHVALYRDLKEVLRRDAYAFRTLPARGASWDRAVFLNLAFWGASDGGDVLVDQHIAADVVAHVAWHRLASRALGIPAQRPTADALFLGEAIASAFDVYLVGRLLGHAPKSSFLSTQVPAMASAASAAGLDAHGFSALLSDLAARPERAFANLRELLFDATSALHASNGADEALGVLARFSSHRFGALLHHYELANWVLYARVYGRRAASPKARAVDEALRKARDPLAWLHEAWVRPALA